MKIKNENIKKILKKNIKYQSKVIEDFKQKRTSFQFFFYFLKK